MRQHALRAGQAASLRGAPEQVVAAISHGGERVETLDARRGELKRAVRDLPKLRDRGVMRRYLGVPRLHRRHVSAGAVGHCAVMLDEHVPRVPERREREFR